MNQDDYDRIIKRQQKMERIEAACIVMAVVGLIAIVIVAYWK